MPYSDPEKKRAYMAKYNPKYYGENRQPLITRIAVVEEKIAEVKAKIESMEAESAVERKMRWEFIIAAVPGILALLTGGML